MRQNLTKGLEVLQPEVEPIACQWVHGVSGISQQQEFREGDALSTGHGQRSCNGPLV
jgi:hypothetical protein